ncbi:MAG: histidine kinase, partial [Verrucomicrobia bacterium]|nr:histidine kinase [Verrucomicrobiota bacterium]
QGVKLICALQPRLPQIPGDAMQLEQAFLNLMLNAAEAMPAGGNLTIATRVVPAKSGPPETLRSVIVEFADTGGGMSEEQCRRAFSSVLSTTKPKGTGLGLAIVGRTVETHNGTIQIKSQPGRGTVIEIIFPSAR